jgi:Na+(H+)/acetate symporter ActP
VDFSFSAWFVILLAAAAANLPFINERVFTVIPVRRSSKSFWLRLFELIVLYFLVLGIANFLEARIGNVFSQRWEFYAITVCLFAVFAYPGFVYRYLRKRHT